MFRFVKLLSILLLIGTAHSRIVRRDALDDEEREVIAQVESDEKEFKELVENVETEIEKLIKKFDDLTQPALNELRNRLSASVGFLEDNIKNLTNIDVAKETCGIVSIREHVTDSYNTAKRCSEKVINDIVDGIRKTLGDTVKLAEEFGINKKKIESCTNSDMTNEDKKKCINEVKKASNIITATFRTSVSAVKSTVATFQVPAKFNLCLASDGSKVLLNKIENVKKCLGTKIPGFAKVANELNKVTEFFHNKFKNIINGFGTFTEGANNA